MRAPTPMDVCNPSAIPMAGMVAIPAIVSRIGWRGYPGTYWTSTVSPTRLWSWASVAWPRTISRDVASPRPETIGGATGDPGTESSVGTSTPSSCIVTNQTPEYASTEWSWRRTANALFGTGPYPSELWTASSQFHPYRAGRDTSVCKLAPNVSVVVTTIIAMTAERSDHRYGPEALPFLAS